jgi:hypothetical protein
VTGASASHSPDAPVPTITARLVDVLFAWVDNTTDPTIQRQRIRTALAVIDLLIEQANDETSVLRHPSAQRGER